MPQKLSYQQHWVSNGLSVNNYSYNNNVEINSRPNNNDNNNNNNLFGQF